MKLHISLTKYELTLDVEESLFPLLESQSFQGRVNGAQQSSGVSVDGCGVGIGSSMRAGFNLAESCGGGELLQSRQMVVRR